MEYRIKQNLGFTLLELIIVMTITIILVSGGVFSTTYILATLNLNTTTHNIETALETAKAYTLDHYNNNTNYGVVFTNTSYQIYAGTTYTTSSPIVDAQTMPGGISIQNISFTGFSYVYFQSLTGAPSNTGSVTIHSLRGNYTVTLTANGAITLTAS